MAVQAHIYLSKSFQRKLELIAGRHKINLEEPGATARTIELCIRAAACERPLCPDCGERLNLHPDYAWWCPVCKLVCVRNKDA